MRVAGAFMLHPECCLAAGVLGWVDLGMIHDACTQARAHRHTHTHLHTHHACTQGHARTSMHAHTHTHTHTRARTQVGELQAAMVEGRRPAEAIRGLLLMGAMHDRAGAECELRCVTYFISWRC